jgi:hypothetical protein
MRASTPIESIDGYFHEMQRVLGEIPREAVLTTVSCLYRAWETAQQVFVLGNGGSA